MVLAKVHSSLEARRGERICFQVQSQCCHNSFPGGSMTEGLVFFCWLLARGCSQLLLMNSESTDLGPNLHLQNPFIFHLICWLDVNHRSCPCSRKGRREYRCEHQGSGIMGIPLSFWPPRSAVGKGRLDSFFVGTENRL